MDITLPVGSTIQRINGDGDSVSWKLPDHTEALPRVVVFRRKPRVGDKYGYYVKLVAAYEDAAGVIKNATMLCEVSNLTFQDATEMGTLWDAFVAAISDADLKDKVLVTGDLPYA